MNIAGRNYKYSHRTVSGYRYEFSTVLCVALVVLALGVGYIFGLAHAAASQRHNAEVKAAVDIGN